MTSLNMNPSVRIRLGVWAGSFNSSFSYTLNCKVVRTCTHTHTFWHGLCLFQMDFQESNLARLLLATGLPSQVHSRLGSGSSSSPCTPAMQRAHPSQVNGIISHHPHTLALTSIICVRLLQCYDMKYLGQAILVSYHKWVLYFTQNANLRSSREAPHSSSMSNMAISPLSPFCPLSPFDDVFWDSAEAPPKVSNNCRLTHLVTCQRFWWLALKWKTSVVLFPWLPTTE